MGVRLDNHRIERTYNRAAPIYDIIFDRIFKPGRRAAIEHLDIQPDESVLEVGIGTGLNLPLYPQACKLTGVDLSCEMLSRARKRADALAMPNVSMEAMDAAAMPFEDDEFDKGVATYTISAAPDPLAVVREMCRVVKPYGTLVILSHFRSERRTVGRIEDLFSPLCVRLGWSSNLALRPFLAAAGLEPEFIMETNVFGAWRLIRCINKK